MDFKHCDLTLSLFDFAKNLKGILISHIFQCSAHDVGLLCSLFKEMTGDKLDIPFNSSWHGKRLGESLAIHHNVWQIIFYASSPKDLMIMLDRFFVHLYLPCIICFITLHSFISLFSKTKNPIKNGH